MHLPEPDDQKPIRTAREWAIAHDNMYREIREWVDALWVETVQMDNEKGERSTRRAAGLAPEPAT